jgi:hypothetical protein
MFALVNPLWKHPHRHQRCVSLISWALVHPVRLIRLTITSLPCVNLTPNHISLNHNILPQPPKGSCQFYNVKGIQSIPKSSHSLNRSKLVQKSKFKVSSEIQSKLIAEDLQNQKENDMLPMYNGKFPFQMGELEPGMVVHTWNPSYPRR